MVETIQELKQYAKEQIEKYPDLRGQIVDFFQLACEEIEDGESESNECELAYDSIEELIKEGNK